VGESALHNWSEAEVEQEEEIERKTFRLMDRIYAHSDGPLESLINDAT
jgi:hypothetical protein